MVDSPFDPFYNRCVEDCPRSFLMSSSPKEGGRSAETTTPNDAGLRAKGRKGALRRSVRCRRMDAQFCAAWVLWAAAKAGLGRRASGTPFSNEQWPGKVRMDQRIEILMATYNGAPYIREQLDSILAQTDRRWRLTISDDGSTDGTDAIVDAYVRQYPERMRRAHASGRFGCARDHFFWLMRQCDADWVLFSDQDDVFYPRKVQVLTDAMRAAEERWGTQTPLLVFSDQTVVDEQLHTLAPSLMRYQQQCRTDFDYRGILLQNVVTGGAMAINRALAQWGAQCSRPKETIMHDWWLAAVAARFGRVIYIDEALGVYRQHESNSVGAKDVASLGYVARMLRDPQGIRESILHKKRQAGVFRDTFQGRLTDDDRVFLQAFCALRSGPRFYLRYRRQIHGMKRLAGFMLWG